MARIKGLSVIYKIVSPSNKIYIGQTIDWDRRFKSYKNHSTPKQVLLYNSIKKYGWENHKIELIEYCTEEKINEKEIYWISYYNSYFKNNEYGLNMTIGGRCVIDKKPYKLSEEARKKISERAKIFCKGKNNPMYGKNHTKETKDKISKINKGRKMSKEVREILNKSVSKPILQYNLEGKFIKEWESATCVQKELNFNSRVINSQARGLRKTAYGFIWKYKN